MVVLDGHNMLGTGPNQYLQPDYLSPLPTTLDAKKSPLALLAQTCSQIGADSPGTKSLLPSLHGSSDSSKRKSSCSSEASSHSHASETQPMSQRDGSQSSSSSSRPRSNGGVKSSSSGGKSSPAFKPYESTPSMSSSSNKNKHDEDKPKTPKSSNNSSPAAAEVSKSSRTTSPSSAASAGAGRSSVTNSEVSPSKSEPSRESKASSESGKASPSGSSKDQGASPIIRSGLEVLHGHMGGGKDLRDYGKPALSSLSALAGYPPGFDPTNPALRPPFFASPSHHAAAAAAFMGYPPATGSGSPYVGYTRVKTPSGAETIVPVCKDPYCTGCQLGMPAGLMAAAAAAGGLGAYQQSVGVCPAGCVQCDHQKFAIGLPFMPPPGLSGIPTSTAAALASYSSSLLSQHQQAAAAQQQQQQQQQQAAAAAAQRPYVCNWIVGDSYCGKRFPSSEELLQHLRTHTNLSTSEAQQMSMSSPQSLYSSALLSSSAAAAAAAAAAAMHRTYPTPPLSPLSAARYHPYASGKPLSSLVPQHPPSLASYYPSPYSIYGQRIGPPVHP